MDGAHIAPLMGTGASDEELLQYVHRAGANMLAARMEHWLEKKGPQDDPRREQGRQTMLEIDPPDPAGHRREEERFRLS